MTTDSTDPTTPTANTDSAYWARVLPLLLMIFGAWLVASLVFGVALRGLIGDWYAKTGTILTFFLAVAAAAIVTLRRPRRGD